MILSACAALPPAKPKPQVEVDFAALNALPRRAGPVLSDPAYAEAIESYRPPPMFDGETGPEMPSAPVGDVEAIEPAGAMTPMPAADSPAPTPRKERPRARPYTAIIDPADQRASPRRSVAPPSAPLRPMDYPRALSGDVLENQLRQPTPQEVLASVQEVEARALPKARKTGAAASIAVPASELVSIAFPRAGAALSLAAKKDILTKAYARLGEEARGRIEIRGYAPPGRDSRPLAYARAQAVRDFLVIQRIAPARMDLRALEASGRDGKADRVDICLPAPQKN